MIIGIGTDIVKIERIKKLCDKSDFLMKHFTALENIYINKKYYPAESAAGIFAAKEAVSKALGTGFSGFDLCDIEIVCDDFGKPTVRLHDCAKELFLSKHGNNICISISHDHDYAIAYATID